MSNQRHLLNELVRKGKPLAEVVIVPTIEDSKQEICDLLNDLAPDISAHIVPAHFQMADADELVMELRVDATQEALKREFGWNIFRVKVYDSSEDNGKYPDCYAWDDSEKPQKYPEALVGKIKDIGLTQPGVNDNGKIDNVTYKSSTGS